MAERILSLISVHPVGNDLKLIGRGDRLHRRPVRHLIPPMRPADEVCGGKVGRQHLGEFLFNRHVQRHDAQLSVSRWAYAVSQGRVILFSWSYVLRNSHRV